MSKMKELYEKVAADSTLQDKFIAIVKDAEEAGEEATHAKLVAFAKEAGYEITIEEMQAFFKAEAERGELSDTELDQVAGGKGGGALRVLDILAKPGSLYADFVNHSMKYINPILTGR